MPEDFSELTSRLTDTARASLARAGSIARNQGSQYVGTEHLLLGVLAQNSSLGAKVLAECGVTLDRAEMALDITGRPVVIMVTEGGMSTEVLETIRTAWQTAAAFGQEKIGTEHIIYSLLLQRDARATRLLRDMNIDMEHLLGNLESMLDRQQFDAMASESDIKTVSGSRSGELKILKRYGIDLTERARANELDPVIGRETEMQRVITVLGRRTKNNPALIGEPGVGKTAVVEGLAQRIVSGHVPESLIGRRIIQLDIAAMVAGAKFRGQFEERLQKVLAVVKKHQEIILFVDELHLLVGAGSAEGSIDASNMLKPALARGEIRLIGATTFDEYRKHIEKDMALSRRFQAVNVNEPSYEQAVSIVAGLSERLATHHRVVISEAMVRLAVDMSERYIHERHLPDKAIDVIDEAASLLRSTTVRQPSKREKLAAHSKQLAGKIDAAVEAEDYQRAAELKTQMKQLEQQIASLPTVENESLSLTEQDIRRAISEITHVPLERLAADEIKDLANLEKRLNALVLGQHEAVGELARAIRRSKAGLNRQAGPLGSFVFLGPTGVGKTELARVLAREVFGGDNNLIKIDMSEFTEKHTASRLVGAPAGYVGYEDGGTLTDRVRRQPYSVVLFDEIEKAHPDVLNLLLQILEDGRLTDGSGRSASFRQTIVILTSNVGADEMVKVSSLGFSSVHDGSRSSRHERNAQAALDRLENFLRPELIGRFDQVITFRPLSRQVVGKIFDNMTQELVQAVRVQNMELIITPAVKRYVINRGFDEARGARVLRRTIQTELADRLTDLLLSTTVRPGVQLIARVREKRVVIDVENQ